MPNVSKKTVLSTKDPPNPKKRKEKRGRPKGSTLGDAELFKRLECVEQSMTMGRFSVAQCVDDLAKAGFPRVSVPTMRRYQGMVREQWAEERVRDREVLRDASLRRLRRYLSSVLRKLKNKEPNHSDAIALFKEIHKIEGVYAPEQVSVTHKVEFDDYTDDELDRYVQTGEEPKRLKGGTVIDGHGEIIEKTEK